MLNFFVCQSRWIKLYCQKPQSEAIIYVATSCSEIIKSFKLGVDSCVKCFQVRDVFKLVCSCQYRLKFNNFWKCLRAERMAEEKGKSRNKITSRIRIWNMYTYVYIILKVDYTTYTFVSTIYFKMYVLTVILSGKNNVKLTTQRSLQAIFFIVVRIINGKNVLTCNSRTSKWHS